MIETLEESRIERAPLYGDEGVGIEMLPESFIEAFSAVAREVHAMAVKKGWWEGGVAQRNKAEMIALMHSELSEALEGLRHGNPPSEKIPGFTAEEEELGDTVIRIFDYSEAFGLRLAAAIIAKIRFNDTRSHKHGGKRF